MCYVVVVMAFQRLCCEANLIGATVNEEHRPSPIIKSSDNTDRDALFRRCTNRHSIITMADNKCPEANSYFGRVKSALLCRRNDLLIMFLVFMQTVQNSWAAANVMVHSELSDGQFSRWISLDSLKFKETSLTPEAG